MLDAIKARLLTERARTKKINAQREHVMQLIQDKASIGESFVILDNPHWVLFEDDYKFFEALGYKVKRHEVVKYYSVGVHDGPPPNIQQMLV